MITCLREWPSRLPPRGAGAPAESLLPAGSLRWYNSGRSALYDALGRLGAPAGAEVLLPAYIAAGVIEPARARGLKVRFYRTGPDLLLDPAALRAELEARPAAKALVVLHPMGRTQPLGGLPEACRARGAALIEDCAQGLFSRMDDGRPLGSVGDVALFSLPKFIGTADGALTVSRGAAAAGPAPGGRPAAARAAGAWHKAHLLANRCLHAASSRALESVLLGLSGALHERYYALAGGDFRPSAPARSTVAAFRALDAERLIERRRRNVALLYAGLASRHVELVYPEDRPGWVPLAVPARVVGADRAELQRRARAEGLLLAALSQRWDHIPEHGAGAFQAERDYLDRHVLIPVNEHIDEAGMRRVVKVLNDLRL